MSFCVTVKLHLEELSVEWKKTGIYAFHKLKYFETYSIGEYEVTPIRGNHGGNMAKERSANYVLKAKDGTKIAVWNGYRTV